MIILRIQYSIYQIARTSKASKSMQSKKAYESSCGIRTMRLSRPFAVHRHDRCPLKRIHQIIPIRGHIAARGITPQSR
jgi:hypothetical protein